MYFFVECGECCFDGCVKLLVYVVGCNLDIDLFDDWWELVCVEFGGDDFGEFFDLKDSVFICIL